jgi:hypothetical protein
VPALHAATTKRLAPSSKPARPTTTPVRLVVVRCPEAGYRPPPTPRDGTHPGPFSLLPPPAGVPRDAGRDLALTDRPYLCRAASPEVPTIAPIEDHEWPS